MAKLEDLKPGIRVKIVSSDVEKDSYLHFVDHTSMEHYIGLEGKVIAVSEEIGNQLPIYVDLESLVGFRCFYFNPNNLEVVTSEKKDLKNQNKENSNVGTKKPVKPVKQAGKKETVKAKPKAQTEKKERTVTSRESTVKEVVVTPGRVSAKLCNVRMDYVNLKEPKKNNFGDYQYSLRIGFFGELSDYLYDALVEAIEKGAPKKWTENKQIALSEKDLERLRKNAIDKLSDKLSQEGQEHFDGAYVLNASAKAEKTGERTFKPKTPIFISPNVNAVYSGCWGDVSITFSFHANDGGGVTVYLNGVRFTGDDTNLGGGKASNPWDDEAETVGESTISDFDESTDTDEQGQGEEKTETPTEEEKPKKKKSFWG